MVAKSASSLALPPVYVVSDSHGKVTLQAKRGFARGLNSASEAAETGALLLDWFNMAPVAAAAAAGFGRALTWKTDRAKLVDTFGWRSVKMARKVSRALGRIWNS